MIQETRAEVFPDVGEEIGGRYMLRKRLGKGGFGAVYRARDWLLGEEVAVKILSAEQQVVTKRRVWREAAVLRLLDIPSVVQLRDEGVDRGHYFLVMSIAPGAIFPGVGIGHWDHLAPRVRALLGSLSLVHSQGVIHGDLKASNVLVTQDGKVTLLDFGVAHAQGWSMKGRAEMVRGTPGYMAPELWRGGAPTPSTDLYAVGVMLFEVLTGERLFQDLSNEEVMRRTALEDLPRLKPRIEGVPAEVCALVEEMMAKYPRERPRSAAEALARLSGGASACTGAGWEARVSEMIRKGRNFHEEELRDFFDGPEELFRLRSGAARQLWRRTLGQPWRVRAELGDWLYHGLARPMDEKLIVERAALERLFAGARISAHHNVLGVVLPREAAKRELLAWLHLAHPVRDAAIMARLVGRREAEVAADIEELERKGLLVPREEKDAILPAPEGLFSGWMAGDRQEAHRRIAEVLEPGAQGRFHHLVRAGEAEEAAQEALRVALSLDRKGDTDRALGILQEGWMALGRRAGPEREEALITTWVKIALASGVPAQIERALVSMERLKEPTQAKTRLEQLLRAALLVCQTKGKAALEALSEISPFEDEELELRRQMYRFQSSWAYGEEMAVEVLDEIERWALRSEDREVRGTVQGWKGLLYYRQGRYEEAAELHLNAAELKRRLSAQLSSLVNAASALIEAHRLEDAADAARRSLEVARRRRQPVYEAHAKLNLRIVAYRMGEPEVPSAAFREAVAELALPDFQGTVGLSEAAAAWRLGDERLARRLAKEVDVTWSRSGKRWGALLARALAVYCGRPSNWVELATMVEQAEKCPLPGVGAQIAALASGAMEEVPPAAKALVEGVWEMMNEVERATRREVLSLEEALAVVTEG